MSAVSVIRSLLTNYQNVTNLIAIENQDLMLLENASLILSEASTVPSIAMPLGTKIMAGILPQGTSLPAIAITEVSRQDRQLLERGLYNRCTSRVQVTIMATTYPQQKQLLGIVRNACRDWRGNIAGVTGVTVLLDGTGPDFQDFDNGFYMQSQDFWVSFVESV